MDWRPEKSSAWCGSIFFKVIKKRRLKVKNMNTLVLCAEVELSYFCNEKEFEMKDFMFSERDYCKFPSLFEVCT